MGSALTEQFAIYPMVEESEATGRVAATYAAILGSMPFVPSLFKSFAVCPQYLVLAWDQASHVLGTDNFDAAATDLSDAASTGTPVDDEEVRTALGEFVGPLARMLVLAAGLLAAAEGQLRGKPASADIATGGRASPTKPIASQWDATAYPQFGEIRRTLDTPIINSIWRSLAEQGLLDRTWAALAPQAAGSRPAAARLQDRAVDAARSVHWPVVADRDALAAAGIDDALPAVTAILDAYVKTLARVLVLVAPSQSH
jgi:hypothetical protein